jgi:phospholipid/cholesterol/gamma-HCH transport system permease protein
VLRPLIRAQIFRSGLRLLPMVGFLAVAMGMIIVAQTVYVLSTLGVANFVGVVMVTVVVRELGPIVTALLVLARVGAATVVELGMARALGEVESLEALGIDPIHYMVTPRLFGIAISIFSLTIYTIGIALASGYVFAFLESAELQPMDYIHQIAEALRWEDFVLLTLKTIGFGCLISVVTCYQGLAQPLRIEEVPAATTRAVAQSVVGCVILDAFIMVVYRLI